MTDTTVTTAAPAAAPAPAGYVKIHSHENGPAYIDCTEFGDSWHQAMTKIDGMFHAIFTHLSGGAHVAAPANLPGGVSSAAPTVDTVAVEAKAEADKLAAEAAEAAKKALADVEAELAALTAKHEALLAANPAIAAATAAHIAATAPTVTA